MDVFYYRTHFKKIFLSRIFGFGSGFSLRVGSEYSFFGDSDSVFSWVAYPDPVFLEGVICIQVQT